MHGKHNFEKKGPKKAFLGNFEKIWLKSCFFSARTNLKINKF